MRVEIGDAVLYCGDCREIIPTLERVDAVVTDPPYEHMKGNLEITTGGGVGTRRNATKVLGNELGSAEGMELIRRVASKGAIAFCSYHWVDKCKALLGGTPKCLIAWYKRNSMLSVMNAPHYMTEFAWAVQYEPGINWKPLRTHYDIPMLQAGCMAAERIVIDGKSAHPTQKPLALMEQMILPGMDSVCDPYMGTGTTGLACVRRGKRFIGIERNPAYFEIAKRRIKEANGVGSLFDPTAAPTLFPLAGMGGDE